MIELFTTCRFHIQWYLSISATGGKVHTAHPVSFELTSRKSGTKKGAWSMQLNDFGITHSFGVKVLCFECHHPLQSVVAPENYSKSKIKKAGFILVLYIGSTLHSGHFAFINCLRNLNKRSPETVFINQYAQFAFINCHHKLL